MSAIPAKHLFSVRELERMTGLGVFTDDARLELLAGEVYEMSAIGPRHAYCVRRLTNLFAADLHGAAVVDAQNPIVLDDFSQPRPDLVLLRPHEDFYADGHPRIEDVLLIVEVADSSLRFDREVKIPLYARAGAPEVWILDLGGNAVEVFAEPGDAAYAYGSRVEDPEIALSPRLLPETSWTMGMLLG